MWRFLFQFSVAAISKTFIKALVFRKYVRFFKLCHLLFISKKWEIKDALVRKVASKHFLSNTNHHMCEQNNIFHRRFLMRKEKLVPSVIVMRTTLTKRLVVLKLSLRKFVWNTFFWSGELSGCRPGQNDVTPAKLHQAAIFALMWFCMRYFVRACSALVVFLSARYDYWSRGAYLKRNLPVTIKTQKSHQY